MKIVNIVGVFVIALMAILVLPQKAQAAVAAPSAILTLPNELQIYADDKRAKILREYLESKKSPLAPYAQNFVAEADKNNIDWRLVAAISGLESSFGVHIPVNSYNGWGFGIYGDNVRRFSSWDEGIATVSKSLRDDYMDKWGATSVPEIGRIYAASPTWAVRVQYFINDIDAFTVKKPEKLALSL